jgi:hypothetical protein
LSTNTPECFISDHAIEMYRERILPKHISRSPEAIHAEIEQAMQRPLFSCVSAGEDALLWGLRNAAGHYFIAVVNRRGPRIEVQTVGPCWYWHETRRHYRKLMKSRRKWR